MEPQAETNSKIKKDKKSSLPKEKVERGGSKKWVMIILLVTVFLSIVFYLLSGNLKFGGFGKPEVKVNIFNDMQEAKYSY